MQMLQFGLQAFPIDVLRPAEALGSFAVSDSPPSELTMQTNLFVGFVAGGINAVQQEEEWKSELQQLDHRSRPRMVLYVS